MKKIFLTMVAAMTALSGFAAPKGNFNLKVELKNFSDTIILVLDSDDEKPQPVVAKNGKVEIDLNDAKPVNLQLVTPATMRQEEAKYVSIIAVPGEKCELKGDYNDRYDINGSRF